MTNTEADRNPNGDPYVLASEVPGYLGSDRSLYIDLEGDPVADPGCQDPSMAFAYAEVSDYELVDEGVVLVTDQGTFTFPADHRIVLSSASAGLPRFE